LELRENVGLIDIDVIKNPRRWHLAATVEGLRGVIAIGDTIEECRRDLVGVIEGWIALSLRMGRTIPPIDGHTIVVSMEPVAIVE